MLKAQMHDVMDVTDKVARPEWRADISTLSNRPREVEAWEPLLTTTIVMKSRASSKSPMHKDEQDAEMQVEEAGNAKASHKVMTRKDIAVKAQVMGVEGMGEQRRSRPA